MAQIDLVAHICLQLGKYPPAVGYQTVGLDNKARNRWRARVFYAVCVPSVGS